MDCRWCGTPFLSGITLASRYGNASLSRGKLRISRMPTLLILTIRKRSNISHDWSGVMLRSLGRHYEI